MYVDMLPVPESILILFSVKVLSIVLANLRSLKVNIFPILTITTNEAFTSH